MLKRLSALKKYNGGIKYRGFNTAAVPSPTYQTSILPNGLTVASESMPGTRTATVGVWINAGSRADNPKSSGTAHFWSIWRSREHKQDHKQL